MLPYLYPARPATCHWLEASFSSRHRVRRRMVMKTLDATVKTFFLSVAAASLLLCSGGVRAETKVTVGVGHMCCAGCQAAAKTALAEVASDVAIDGTNVTVTLKDNATDIVPVLDALRKGGFPATKIEAGSGPVTIGVAHLCCGGCSAALDKALRSSKIEALNLDSIKVADGALTLKAKEGQSLDLVPVLASMEKAGFSPKSITMGAATAALRPKAKLAAH